MFDVGMGELFIFAVIALIILGPEKLPIAIKALAKWYVRIKKMIGNIQQDIEKQLNISELRQQMQDKIKRIEDLEVQMQEKFAVLERQNQQLLQQAVTQNKVNKNKVLYHYTTQQIWHVPYCADFAAPLKSTPLSPISTATPQNMPIQLKVAV